MFPKVASRLPMANVAFKTSCAPKSAPAVSILTVRSLPRARPREGGHARSPWCHVSCVAINFHLFPDTMSYLLVPPQMRSHQNQVPHPDLAPGRFLACALPHSGRRDQVGLWPRGCKPNAKVSTSSDVSFFPSVYSLIATFVFFNVMQSCHITLGRSTELALSGRAPRHVPWLVSFFVVFFLFFQIPEPFTVPCCP